MKTFYLTKNDAQEVVDKMRSLKYSAGLQGYYGVSQTQVDSLFDSVPRDGGVWVVTSDMFPAVFCQMSDHIACLRYSAARDGLGEEQGLRRSKQAARLEKIFGKR
jgi:hypothetical protein